MTTDTVVRARIDEKIKDEATSVLRDMGLTVSDAIRLLLIQVAAQKALPFPVRVPNAKTQEAMTEAETGKAARFDSAKDLMADLNADD